MTLESSGTGKGVSRRSWLDLANVADLCYVFG